MTVDAQRIHTAHCQMLPVTARWRGQLACATEASGSYSRIGSDGNGDCVLDPATSGRQKEHTSWPMVGYPHAGHDSIATVTPPENSILVKIRYPRPRRFKRWRCRCSLIGTWFHLIAMRVGFARSTTTGIRCFEVGHRLAGTVQSNSTARGLIPGPLTTPLTRAEYEKASGAVSGCAHTFTSSEPSTGSRILQRRHHITNPMGKLPTSPGSGLRLLRLER
jgi:hypothetical protein